MGAVGEVINGHGQASGFANGLLPDSTKRIMVDDHPIRRKLPSDCRYSGYIRSLTIAQPRRISPPLRITTIWPHRQQRSLITTRLDKIGEMSVVDRKSTRLNSSH